MVISSPCLADTKNWIVQSKRLWVINAPCYCNKALTSPVQTTTGKETSNPLMADDHKDKECSQEVIGYNPQKLNQKKLEVNKVGLDQVVNTLACGDRGQGFDPHPLQGRRSFSTFGKTGSNLSTFGRGRAVYVSTSPIHCGRRYWDP
ncbi:hypothetical protein Tco_1039589 [Tanacetum coccineum]